MIELKHDDLEFSFPEVHPDAHFSIDFQRTLRIPDDGHDYPLPAGLGRFPLRHVDDYSTRIPASWREHGGVMMPIYQAEALWVDFTGSYPIAVKIAAGKINAVTGEEWNTGLQPGPSPSEDPHHIHFPEDPVQDYLVLPEQPWLDGFNIGAGRIRQFVAMPLGHGYTAEEQITGAAEHGGLQIVAYPMKASAYETMRSSTNELMDMSADMACGADLPPSREMGLGLGGRMRQDIDADPHDFNVWDQDHPARCYVHLTNSGQWASITGQTSPSKPPTAKDYQQAGIPWFSHYTDGDTVPGSPTLADLDTITSMAASKGDPVPDNTSIPIDRVTLVRNQTRPDLVRESGDL